MTLALFINVLIIIIIIIYYRADQPTIVQLIEKADETLFNNIRYNPLHILHPLLPEQIGYCYSLRPRSHISNLPAIMTTEILLIECSFAIPVALSYTSNTNLHRGFLILLLL